MKKKNYKKKIEKKHLSKSKEVCRFWNPVQKKFSELMNEDSEVREIICNFPLEEPMEDYTTDVVLILQNGQYQVRECVQRNLLTKPMNITLLDQSREYWLLHGVEDWGLVINEEE